MTTRTVKPETVCADQVDLVHSASAHSADDQLRSQKRLWLAALKPPMYCVAVMPICVGSAVAYVQTGRFRADVFSMFALSAILLLVWENLSNDVFDAETGIDVNKHHSLVNLTSNRQLIFWIGNVCLLLGVAGVLTISLTQHDSTVLAMVLACCALGYLYQGPPFRLGYRGIGEILCFLSFGPLAVGAAYYSQTQSWGPAGWLAGWQLSSPLLPAAIIVGIGTTLVLFCSHFHQIEDDLKAGKRSPVARLGTQRGAQLLPAACTAVLLTALAAIAQGGLPLGTLLILGSLPAAIKLCLHVLTFHNQPERVKNSKFLAIHFHFWSGSLLLIGLIASTAI
ncbi:1,4-dihydroxy-2-naphthoate phytyltransferase [Synechococcus sp. PCC 7335]|uniref:2-carboxy-1,4-naphthoquinone phytyltransferase n=1 Tax=Synechococcus sp. (strain ATCC 29403 / PCC 7335) TaxID=91464 RepID=UPI00017EBFE5|nr:2-carboxy-1,4-naphthoquinone phytyltransferase [Synechococcus sp. PCC 7335]EDX86986.1 1,4-dihydroxy-2-naphthoate phytyltransferase [Synechococcus sp. PCC 7335]